MHQPFSGVFTYCRVYCCCSRLQKELVSTSVSRLPTAKWLVSMGNTRLINVNSIVSNVTRTLALATSYGVFVLRRFAVILIHKLAMNAR